MENTNDACTMEPPQDVYVLKKVRAPERYLPNGKYNAKPLSPTYGKEYYARKRCPVECPHCSQKFEHPDVLRQHVRRSKKCINLRNIAELKAALEAAGIKNENEAVENA